ncbi:alpha-L-rhamnosidase [Klebsiella pneumoniae]|nr:alpha-L-rhamnosidase [Klebsiella pneumoniae]
MRDSDDWWVFIDWQAELNKQASAQGVLIYCLQRALWLAQRFEPQRVPYYTATLWQLKEAALHHLWDNDRQVFISGAVRQVSWASQIWLVLAEVGTAGQRQALMRRLQQQPPAIAMNTRTCVIITLLPCYSPACARRRWRRSKPTFLTK